jgi:hypothetical protein
VLDYEEGDKVKHVLNTVNGDLTNDTVAQNATQVDNSGDDGGVLDRREHD